MSTGLSLKQAAGQADLLCPGFLTDPNAFKDDYCRTVRSLIRSLAQDTDTTQQLGDPNMGFAHSAAATGVDGVDGAGALVINKQLLKHYDDLERDGRARSVAGKARGLSTSQFTLDVRAHNAAQTAAYETQLAQYMTDMTAWAAAGVALAAWNAVAANAAAVAAAAPGVAPPGQPAAPGMHFPLNNAAHAYAARVLGRHDKGNCHTAQFLNRADDGSKLTRGKALKASCTPATTAETQCSTPPWQQAAA